MTLEALKYLNLLLWRLVQDKISAEYGVFQHSATSLLWSFTASMIVLAGAEWSARKSTRGGDAGSEDSGFSSGPITAEQAREVHAEKSQGAPATSTWDSLS